MNDKLKHRIINHLNKEYSGLIPYETERWDNSIFFMKDGKAIYEYNKGNGVVYVSYGNIWSFLESFFGLDYEEIQVLTKEWVEGQFKSYLESTRTAPAYHHNLDVEEQFNSDITMTDVYHTTIPDPIEEQFKLDLKITTDKEFSITDKVEEQFKSFVTTTLKGFRKSHVSIEEEFKSDFKITMIMDGITYEEVEERFKSDTNE
jgi:hypothetical protein